MAEEPVHRIEPDAELGLAPPPYQYPARHVLNGDFIHQSVILDQILSLLDRAFSAIARLSMNRGGVEDQEDADMIEVEQLCQQIPDDEPIEVNGEAEEVLPGPSTGLASHPDPLDRAMRRHVMRGRMVRTAMSRAEAGERNIPIAFRLPLVIECDMY
jgi:hypothetical protein